MDFMSLRLNSSNLTCSICSLAAIILQLVAMESQKLHMVDSPIGSFILTLLGLGDPSLWFLEHNSETTGYFFMKICDFY